MRNIRSIAVAVAMSAVTVPAAAQTRDMQAALCPGGDVTRIRLSKIKPGATLADFKAAMAAHSAWYKAHGFKIEQRLSPVLEYDAAAQRPKQSADEVMTFATGDFVPQDKQDDSWKAYVAKYRAVSDLMVEKVACVPHAGG